MLCCVIILYLLTANGRMSARSHCALDPLVRRSLLPNTGLISSARSADTVVFRYKLKLFILYLMPLYISAGESFLTYRPLCPPNELHQPPALQRWNKTSPRLFPVGLDAFVKRLYCFDPIPILLFFGLLLLCTC